MFCHQFCFKGCTVPTFLLSQRNTPALSTPTSAFIFLSEKKPLEERRAYRHYTSTVLLCFQHLLPGNYSELSWQNFSSGRVLPTPAPHHPRPCYGGSGGVGLSVLRCGETSRGLIPSTNIVSSPDLPMHWNQG